MVRRPIEQLYGLLRERLEVGDQIRQVQAELDSIKTTLSGSLVQQALENSGTDRTTREQLMKEERNRERLLQALRDAKTQIEERVGSAAEQAVQAEIAQLKKLSEQHQSALRNCLSQIDQNILSFYAQIDEYRRRCSELAEVNQSLATLGAAPVIAPHETSAPDLVGMLQSRFEELQNQGKI